jgi:amidase
MNDTTSDPLAQLDATAQARLVRRGDVAARELVDAAVRRIERVDARLGAVPIRLIDEARAQILESERARGPRGPLFGVPFLMKDVGARQAGQPYYAGNRALREIDHRAKEDTPLGARFRELGLVTVGKSSTPEFGLQSNTWTLAYGPTRNPWDPARCAGGSSGGACAAVAAGLVPVAHASDGAGSIRIPAAWCGLVGLKPTRDRVVWRHAGRGRPDVEFVVARSLRDTAGMLDELRVRDGDEDDAPYSAALRRRPDRLVVRVCVESPRGSRVDPACAAAVERTASRLAELGHDVAQGVPPSFAEYADRCLYGAVLGTVEYRMCLADLGERLGRSIGPDDVEPFLWELAQVGADATRDEIAAASAFETRWVETTRRWFAHVDVLVTPTVSEPAPLLTSLDPRRLSPLEMLDRMAPHMAFTEPWNATGQPAISLPLAATDTGLPVGVQLVAGFGNDALLLSVAAQLMDLTPDPNAPIPRIHA